MVRFQLTVILLFIIVLSVPNAESSFRPEVFAYEEGYISIKGRSLSVVDLLKHISEIANVQIFVFDPVENCRISLDLDDVTCHSALKSIIKSANFAIVYFEEAEPFISNNKKYDASETVLFEKGLANNAVLNDPQKRSVVLSSGVLSASIENELTEYESTAQNGSDRKRNKKVFLVAGIIDRIQDHGMNDLFSSADYSTHGSVSGDMISENEDFYSEEAQGSEQQNPFMSDGTWAAFPLEAPVSSEHLSQMIDMLKQRIASGESDREYEKWAGIKGARYITHDRERLSYYQSKIQEQ